MRHAFFHCLSPMSEKLFHHHTTAEKGGEVGNRVEKEASIIHKENGTEKASPCVSVCRMSSFLLVHAQTPPAHPKLLYWGKAAPAASCAVQSISKPK